MPLKLGMFLTPASNPTRPMSEIIDWNLDVIRKAEECGYDGVCVLYQNHPLTIAAHLAQLDHMARGRINFGLGAGATVSDKIMFGVDGATSHEMLLEAVEIILQCWSETGPREFNGKYWKVHPPVDAFSGGNYGWHHRPYAPHEPRIAFASGFGPRSSLLRLAGEHGYIPMSLNFFAAHLRGHWDCVVEGAQATGRTADRGRWRMLRDIFVADTDAQARRAVLGGFAARFWNEYFKPIAEKLNATHIIREQFELAGGFGTLLMLGSDYADPGERESWFRSMELLSREVMPRLADLPIRPS